jgi:hypothetical protein
MGFPQVRKPVSLCYDVVCRSEIATMKKHLVLNIRVDTELRDAIDAWRDSQPADASYGAFFRYAAKEILKRDGLLSADYTARNVRTHRGKKSVLRDDA